MTTEQLSYRITQLAKQICCIKQSISSGGSIPSTFNIQDTSSINLEGNGTLLLPLTSEVNLFNSANNAIIDTGAGLYVPQFIQQGLIYGGIVTWHSNYTYEVTAAGYYISGVFYTSPARTVAGGNPVILDAPNATFNRIDVFYVDTTSTVNVLKGIPSSTPTKPDVSDIQIELSFALVEVGTTQPSLNIEQIYLENTGEPTEWLTTTDAPTRIIVGSFASPLQGTKSVEGTSTINSDTITFTNNISIVPTLLNSVIKFNILVKNIGTINKRRFQLYFSLGGTTVGTTLNMNDGSYGFVAGNTTTIQTIAIPLSTFGLTNSNPIDKFNINISNNSGVASGFWIDDVEMQGVPIPVVGTPYELILTTLGTSGASTYNPLNNTLNVPNYAGATGITTETDPLAWKLLGNAGTVSGTNFLGTTDNIPLQFRVNNLSAGYIGIAPVYATTFGVLSMRPTVNIGVKNSAFGAGTLYNNTTGTGNSSFGYTSLYNNTTGNYNMGVGWAALGYNKTGNFNVAIGGGALNTSNAGETFGSGNTAIGYRALENLFTGDYNIGLGFQSGINKGGDSNTLFVSPNTTKMYMDLDTVVGQAPKVVGIDINGFWHKYDAASGGGGADATTASNGLTEVGDNIKLGGTLIEETTINNGIFRLNTTSSHATETFKSVNTGNGRGVSGFSINSSGIEGSSTNGSGLAGISENSFGVAATSINSYGGFFASTPSSTNTIHNVLLLTRDTTGVAANGIGLSIDFTNSTTTTGGRLSNRLISKWLIADGTSGLKSSFSIQGRIGVASVIENLAIFDGDGKIQFPKYGINTFAGTPTYALGTDAIGNIVEFTPGGASTRFGYPLEDVTAAQNREFIHTGYSFRMAAGDHIDYVNRASEFLINANNTFSFYSQSNSSLNYSTFSLAPETITQSSTSTTSNRTSRLTLNGGQAVLQTQQTAANYSSLTSFYDNAELTVRSTINNYITSLHLVGGRITFNHLTVVPFASVNVASLTDAPGNYTIVKSVNGNLADASGNVTIASGGGAIVTANNGLAKSLDNIKLGGTLTENTTIEGLLFNLTINTTGIGANALTLESTNGAGLYSNGLSNGLTGRSPGGTGVTAQSVTGIALEALTGGGNLAGRFYGAGNDNSSITSIISVDNFSNIAPTAGFGAAINFNLQTSGGTGSSNKIKSSWINPTDATLTSQLTISGRNNAIENTLLKLNGDGKIQFPKYGVNTFAGTPTYALGVDATGNIVEKVAPKIYTALISQTGLNAPTAIVLENTLGAIPVWIRNAVGQYEINLIGAWTLDKTVILMGKASDGDASSITCLTGGERVDSNSIYIITRTITDGIGDSLLRKTSIEIKVYP